MATKKTETPIETATMNVWQKLLASRMDFLKQKVKQSGVNLHAEFTYFELKDIVPVATDIFAKYNCVFLTTFPEGKAVKPDFHALLGGKSALAKALHKLSYGLEFQKPEPLGSRIFGGYSRSHGGFCGIFAACVKQRKKLLCFVLFCDF